MFIWIRESNSSLHNYSSVRLTLINNKNHLIKKITHRKLSVKVESSSLKISLEVTRKERLHTLGQGFNSQKTIENGYGITI